MGDTSSLITMFLCIALLILWRRYRSMHRPIKGNGKRILLPLLFLSPGILMFLVLFIRLQYTLALRCYLEFFSRFHLLYLQIMREEKMGISIRRKV